MRFPFGPALAAMLLAASTAASAQGAGPSAKTIDRAGEAAATKGAPGTVVPGTPDEVKAPGLQAPVETKVPPSAPPKAGAPAAK
jgi:hypothetical protein